MTTSHVRIGLAGCLLMAAVVASHAQEAAPPRQAAEQPSCSGLMCIFSSHAASDSPAPAPVAQAEAPAATANAPDPDAAKDQPAAKTSTKASKPARPVTIAADPRDIVRLKALAVAVPKSIIKFVKANNEDADFTVDTTLDDVSSDRRVKLFTEQIHIVAGAGVKTVADLRDKVVSFGPSDSPTRAAARKALEALAIPVKETSLDYDNAFDGLATGDIDAVVVLAPQPSSVLKKLKGPGLHLLAWPDGAALPNGAAATTILGNTYPQLAPANASLRAVGVDAVLTMSAKGAKQPAARSFFASLSQHSAALSKRGFDLLKADIDERSGRRVASAERR